MKFLFHTLIMYEVVAVYYNIYSKEQHYLAEVLSNPSQLQDATNFELYNDNGEWHSSISLPTRCLDIVGEEIDNYNRSRKPM